jgi:predicted RND superfamily exporter protein
VHPEQRHNRVEEALGGAVAAVARASGRFPKAVLLLFLLVTLVMAGGLGRIYVRSADYDLLPNGHPSTLANERALPEIPGYRSVETFYMEVADPSQNITGEAEIRALYGAQRFIDARVPTIKYDYNLAYLVRFINYTASGVPAPCTIASGLAGNGSAPQLPPGLLPNGTLPPLPPPPAPPGPAGEVCYRAVQPPDLAAFALPDSSEDFARDWNILFNAAPGTVEAIVTEDFKGTIVVFAYDVNLTLLGPPAVLPESHKFIEAVEDFRLHECPRLVSAEGKPLFRCDHVYILGEAINAHLTDLANEDFQTWGPIVFVATLLVLVFAFGGDLVSTAIAFLAFTMGLVWTYGYMGYAGIPLTFFGLLIVPITLGVGKEYAIYITNQILDYGSRGMPKWQVLDLAGRRAGGALLVASVTSVAGLATMYLAEFKIMQDLAVLSTFSFLSLFLLSITFIPAAHALRRRVRRYRFTPSRSMGWVGRGATRHKAVLAGLLVVGTVLLAAESTQIEEYFGISGGFQEGDYLEESYQYYNQAFGGSGTELVVIEGDVADPSFIQYLRDLDASFKQDTQVIPKASNVNSLIIALETYYSLKDGLFNPAALNGKLNRSSIPNDRATLEKDIRDNLYHPVFSHVQALFVGPHENIAVTHVFYHIRSESFQGLEEDWNSLNADVARVPKPPSVREVNLVGTQDTFYLYVKYGQPWLGRVTLYASVLTFVIAAIVLRRPRDIAAVMVPMLMAGVWWAGLLPLFDIKASLTLMLPTVFLISVGSDYAIQYVWNYRQIGDMGEVYASTGKANLWVVAASVLAFLLFVPMKLVLSSQGALAAALAIVTIFGVTTLAVPLFYPAKAFGAKPAAQAGEAPSAASAVSIVTTEPR